MITSCVGQYLTVCHQVIVIFTGTGTQTSQQAGVAQKPGFLEKPGF
jgi:hypothetical protein